MGLLDFFGLNKKEDPDEATLKRLKSTGSDLSKPHNIGFYLYFPSQFAAEKAAIRIKKSGFHTSIINSKKGDWLCLATKKMVPELSAFRNFRTEFGHLFQTFGGKYDGWGTEAEK
ncbi:MAG: ribonuclease E inhibitor RraB [Sedimentisphaerales bacterium]|nr:ribonuclease E inhibitor RraB [Sedimentisphaerales bacterium]